MQLTIHIVKWLDNWLYINDYIHSQMNIKVTIVIYALYTIDYIHSHNVYTIDNIHSHWLYNWLCIPNQMAIQLTIYKWLYIIDYIHSQMTIQLTINIFKWLYTIDHRYSQMTICNCLYT